MHRFLAACSLLFLLPFSSVRASGPFISETAWAGSSASLADEWLEICAAPGTDLTGWSIEGAAASPIAFPDGAAVPASGAFVIANYAADDARSTLALAPDLVTTAVALSNSALMIVLRGADGALVDVAGDGGAPPAGASGEAKASMERADAAAPWTTASTSSGFDDGAPEFGTPGSCGAIAEPAAEEAPETEASATSTPVSDAETPIEPSPAPAVPLSPVRIAEIYPSPNAGEREWVELVNPSSVGEFLDGWSIEDAAGTKTRLEGLLLPWGRLVIESPKGSLNNDGDTIVLRDALGRELDRAAYGKIAKGSAVMRVELQETFVVTLTPTPGAANAYTEKEEAPPLPPVVPSEAEGPLAAQDAEAIPPPVTLDRNDVKTGAAAATPVPVAKKPEPAAKPAAKSATPKTAKPAAPKYKGASYVATIAVPPGAYAKTRAYVLLDGAVAEVRFSKSPAAAWKSGDRIAFIAQTKTEGAAEFLLANPNSVRVLDSASATFAAAEAWPEEAGGYRFTAEVASIRGNALEVTLGGVEGDVLAPAGASSALKPGDRVRVEGFISPGPRPQVVLPHAGALLLEHAYADEPAAERAARLPAAYAIGLTITAGAVGLAAYLRAQRLKRLALTRQAIDPAAWE